MCASACVSTVPQGGHKVASASELAAVPEETANTRTSVPKNLPNTDRAARTSGPRHTRARRRCWRR